jgi:hypothetical protein
MAYSVKTCSLPPTLADENWDGKFCDQKNMELNNNQAGIDLQTQHPDWSAQQRADELERQARNGELTTLHPPPQ